MGGNVQLCTRNGASRDARELPAGNVDGLHVLRIVKAIYSLLLLKNSTRVDRGTKPTASPRASKSRTARRPSSP